MVKLVPVLNIKYTIEILISKSCSIRLASYTFFRRLLVFPAASFQLVAHLRRSNNRVQRALLSTEIALRHFLPLSTWISILLELMVRHILTAHVCFHSLPKEQNIFSEINLENSSRKY